MSDREPYVVEGQVRSRKEFAAKRCDGWARPGTRCARPMGHGGIHLSDPIRERAEPVRATDPMIQLWRCDKGHWISEDAVQPLPGQGEELGHCPYPCMAPCVGPFRAALAADREPEPVPVPSSTLREAAEALVGSAKASGVIPTGSRWVNVSSSKLAALAAALPAPPPEGESDG